MTFGFAIALCSNLNQPEERAEFTEEEILEAIHIVLDHEGHDVIKKALRNMCEYLLEQVDNVSLSQ